MNKEIKHILDDNSEMKLSNHFQVPDNYFEKMESEVMFRTMPLSESKKSQTTYFTPELYFDELPSAIDSQKESILATSKKENFYTIPQEYFQALEKNISQRTDFNLVSTKDTPYKVNENYFDDFPRKVQRKINSKEKSSEFNPFPFLLQPKYALVSVFTILFFALLIYNPFQDQVNKKCVNDIACLNKKEIEKHIENKLIQDIDENDIMDMIYENGNDFTINKKIVPEDKKDVEDYLINNAADNIEIDEL